MTLLEYLSKPDVMFADRSLLVLARTDAYESQWILIRVQAFEQAGLRAGRLRCGVGGWRQGFSTHRSDACGRGLSCVQQRDRQRQCAAVQQALIYSTPGLVAAQGAIEQALDDLSAAEADLSGALASPR